MRHSWLARTVLFTVLLLSVDQALAMRIVLQRVKSASVTVEDAVVSSINRGVLALVGLREGDTTADLEYCAKKLCAAKLWENEEGKGWRKAARQLDYEVLRVSHHVSVAPSACLWLPLGRGPAGAPEAAPPSRSNHASGCPVLRPASANRPLGRLSPVIPASLSWASAQVSQFTLYGDVGNKKHVPDFKHSMKSAEAREAYGAFKAMVAQAHR